MAAAFSMYSKIPMPRFEWKETDMSRSLIFFPLVGAVIGALVCFINCFEPLSVLPAAVRIMLTVLSPIAVTGGFHLDGFMDSKDALSSYGAREKKLEILKDPHIGAFAVISLVKWLLIYGACISAVLLKGECSLREMAILGMTFVISRSLSGITSILFTKAKDTGMLRQETSSDQRGTLVCLAVWLVLSAAGALLMDVRSGAMVLASFALFTMYYRSMAYREFGGVTGDTAGYFLTASEAAAAAALAISIYIF